MLYFLLAVTFTVLLYLLFRAFPRYGVHSFHAIVFNYYSCVLVGYLLLPDRQALQAVSWTAPPTLLTMLLGSLFVITFVLIGQSTQKVSVTAASLAANMSLVIPVVFGLFVFQNTNKVFTPLNYAGLVLALVALGLGAVQSEPKTSSNATKLPLYLLALPLLTFLASGANNTLINYLSMTFYAPQEGALFTLIACVGAVLVGTTWLLVLLLRTGEKLLFRSVVGGLVLGVPNVLSFYFLLKALGAFGNSAAFVFPIYNILSMLASAAAAWLLFRERLSPLNRLGLALAVLAIVLISYQELGM